MKYYDALQHLAPQAAELLKKVQNIIHSNVTTLVSMDMVYKKISFAIIKD